MVICLAAMADVVGRCCLADRPVKSGGFERGCHTQGEPVRCSKPHDIQLNNG